MKKLKYFNKEENKKCHVKTGELVQIICGDDKNKTGKILRVDIKKNLVKIKDCAMKTHFISSKKNKNIKPEDTGIKKIEGWIHASNVKKILEGDVNVKK